MHSLDIIIRRNAEAAGRAEAHARNDGDHARARRILENSVYGENELAGSPRANAYERGYARGRQEG